MKKRVDQQIVDLGLAPSRAKAQELIKRKEVYHSGKLITKASEIVPPEGLEVKSSELLKYVGRGGLKLEGALKDFNVDAANMNCVDLGASTGGFTHCLLQSGARHVDAVDVGHGQLHERLKLDPRVTNFEGQDVREFKGGPYDLIVADLSFISLTKVLPSLRGLAHSGTKLVLLFKPQFEVGSVNIGKGGIVKTDEVVQECIGKMLDYMKSIEILNCKVRPSKLAGKDGNLEYFLYGECK